MHITVYGHICSGKLHFSPKRRILKALIVWNDLLKLTIKFRLSQEVCLLRRSLRTFSYLSIQTFLWKSSIPSRAGHCRDNSKVRAQKSSPSISFPNPKPSSKTDLPRDASHLSQHHQSVHPTDISASLLVQVLLVALVWDKCSYVLLCW